MSPRRPLDDVELLLVDGNNLLHRVAGGVDSGALRTLLPRLQGALQAPVKAVVVLDGHAAPGEPWRQQLGGSLEIRQAGSISADDAILELLTARPYASRARTIVVSDDRALVERARSAGGRTQRLDWLQDLLSRPAPGRSGTIGSRTRQAAPDAAGDAEPESWRPGRGATRKRGNPRRQRRGA